MTDHRSAALSHRNQTRERVDRLVRAAGLCVVVAMAPMFAPAGFDHTNTDGVVVNDGEAIGSNDPSDTQEEQFPQDTIDKIIDEFEIEGTPEEQQEAAETKLRAMQNNIATAIDKIRAQDSEIADCLEDAMNATPPRLCIDFVSTGANGTIIPNRGDDSTDCDTDRINVNVHLVPCGEQKSYHPSMYQLMSTLLHEGKHSLQDYRGREGLNDDDWSIRKAKDRACNELEAEELENEVICELIGLLDDIINDGTEPPDPAESMAECIARDLWECEDGDNDPAAAAAAATALKSRLEQIKNGNAWLILRWTAYKPIACSAEDGDITREEMNEQMRATSIWLRDLRDLLEGSTWAYRGDPNAGSRLVQEMRRDGANPGEDDQSFDTPLDQITDVAFLGPDRETMVVIGREGSGVSMYTYDDTDGDRFYEPATEQFLAAVPVASGAAPKVQVNPANGDLLVFDRSATPDVFFGSVLRYADLDLDGRPETLMGPGLAPTIQIPSDFHDFAFEGQTLAFHTSERTNVPAFLGVIGGEPVLTVRDENGDGQFEQGGGYDVFGEGARFAPMFVTLPLAGDLSGGIHGLPQVGIELHQLDLAGGSLGVIGLATTDDAGEGQYKAAFPLVEGMIVELREPLNQTASGPIVVGAAPCVADWNGDGFVNTADLLAYLNDFVAVQGGGVPIHGDPDLAPPAGVINTADFIAFLNLFAAGC